jgi:hypothetical protein
MPPHNKPAAINPNMRPACSRVKMSAMSDQKTATTNKLKTLTHTKYARPAAMCDADPSAAMVSCGMGSNSFGFSAFSDGSDQ